MFGGMSLSLKEKKRGGIREPDTGCMPWPFVCPTNTAAVPSCIMTLPEGLKKRFFKKSDTHKKKGGWRIRKPLPYPAHKNFGGGAGRKERSKGKEKQIGYQKQFSSDTLKCRTKYDKIADYNSDKTSKPPFNSSWIHAGETQNSAFEVKKIKKLGTIIQQNKHHSKTSEWSHSMEEAEFKQLFPTYNAHTKLFSSFIDRHRWF